MQSIHNALCIVCEEVPPMTGEAFCELCIKTLQAPKPEPGTGPVFVLKNEDGTVYGSIKMEPSPDRFVKGRQKGLPAPPPPRL